CHSPCLILLPFMIHNFLSVRDAPSEKSDSINLETRPGRRGIEPSARAFQIILPPRLHLMLIAAEAQNGVGVGITTDGQHPDFRRSVAMASVAIRIHVLQFNRNHRAPPFTNAGSPAS